MGRGRGAGVSESFLKLKVSVCMFVHFFEVRSLNILQIPSEFQTSEQKLVKNHCFKRIVKILSLKKILLRSGSHLCDAPTVY